MGQQASSPKPGAKLQVIGAGLPCTANTTLNRALEILLDGPVYHGGTQVCKAAPTHMRSWIAIMERTPTRGPDDEKFITRTIPRLLDGYVATTDGPGMCFVPELVQLYPDAKVVCLTRDLNDWVRSWEPMADGTMRWYLRGLLLPLLAPMRLLPQYMDALMAGRWEEMYHLSEAEKKAPGPVVWKRHIENLKRAVPADRLVFYDVKEGWGPLCEALGREVPKGVPFPAIIYDDGIQEFAQREVMRAIVRWLAIMGSAVGAYWAWMSYPF
ncbi:hypothetical protein VM1G_08244 [Cytospora mali]|uniref:NAD dependent epimerase/dehydratase n=1 Tax=Cytospora mali TaxID=578113 RepID=A0A194W850_CYTMA|nr:hypothetical protein VM1G_08244 [Valsa mali]